MRNLNPTVLAIGAFCFLIVAGTAQAQQRGPMYPPSANPQGYGYPGSYMPYGGKPLPTTVYGDQPIDPSQSADAVLNYVQKEVESRVRLAPGGTRFAGGNTYEIIPPTLDLSPALRNAMAPIIAKFGVENLEKALKLGTQPRQVDGDMSSTVDTLKNYEGSIIRAALVLAQGGSTTANARPLGALRPTLPYSPPDAATPTPPPVPPAPVAPAVPDPAPPVATNAAPAVVPSPVTAPLQTATVTAKTKIETHTPSGGYAALPLDVGDQLTILSINNDGTVTAEAKYHFHGTVHQSDIHINAAAAP